MLGRERGHRKWGEDESEPSVPWGGDIYKKEVSEGKTWNRQKKKKVNIPYTKMSPNKEVVQIGGKNREGRDKYVWGRGAPTAVGRKGQHRPKPRSARK